ncbi:MAG: hypothetical protein QHJ82_08525 [Verrucomicrobiota bacterium]|nr:hypothetical protein [Verrucomicrobiota bacterium]
MQHYPIFAINLLFLGRLELRVRSSAPPYRHLCHLADESELRVTNLRADAPRVPALAIQIVEHGLHNTWNENVIAALARIFPSPA